VAQPLQGPLIGWCQ